MWLVVVWPCGEGGELTKKTQEGEGGGIRLGGIGGRIVDSFWLAQNQEKTVES